MMRKPYCNIAIPGCNTRYAIAQKEIAGGWQCHWGSHSFAMADPLPLLEKTAESDDGLALAVEPRPVFARRWYILFVMSLIAMLQVGA